MQLKRDAVIRLIRDKQGGRSMRRFAEDIGLSAGYLSDVYRGFREPGPTLLELLNLAKVTTTTYATKD